MNFNEYQEAAVKTAIYPKKHAITYPVLGLVNEAGEVAGKLKKIYRDGNGEFTEEAKQNIADEIGDVLWYIASALNDLGITLESVAQNNISKLQSRQARGVLQGSGDKR